MLENVCYAEIDLNRTCGPIVDFEPMIALLSTELSCLLSERPVKWKASAPAMSRFASAND